MPWALVLDLDNAGSSMPARMAMIAMTTSSSIRVKPAVPRLESVPESGMRERTVLIGFGAGHGSVELRKFVPSLGASRQAFVREIQQVIGWRIKMVATGKDFFEALGGFARRLQAGTRRVIPARASRCGGLSPLSSRGDDP